MTRKLTPRRQQLLDLVQRGITNYKDLAGHLGVAPKTVSTHLLHLRAAFGVRRTKDLIVEKKEDRCDCPW